MAFTNFGLNCRNTGPYVGDPAGTIYFLSTDAYLTSRAPATIGFGYTSFGGIASANRTTAGDHRLAGMHFVSQGVGLGPAIIEIDLEPGTGANYNIYAAFGDPSNGQTINLTIADDASVFKTITNVNTGGPDEYLDATEANRTRTQWLADSTFGGTPINRTFVSSKCIITINEPNANSSCIATIFFEQVTPPVTPDDLMGQMVM